MRTTLKRALITTLAAVAVLTGTTMAAGPAAAVPPVDPFFCVFFPEDPLCQPPAQAPDAATNLAATAGTEQVDLSWDPASGAAAYTVFYRTSPDGIWAFFNSVYAPTTTITVTGLTAGVTYDFKVEAVNDAGTAPASNIATATPTAAAAAPNSPYPVLATPGDGTVTLDWQAAAANGSPVTGYVIFWQVAPDPGYVYLGAVDPTTLTYTVPGLTNGTTYYFAVMADSAAGGSEPTFVEATPSATAPDPDPTPTPDRTTVAAPQPATSTATITYDAVGGSCAATSQTLAIGSTPTAPACTPAEGYRFTGWAPAIPATLTGDVTVRAQYEPAPKPGRLTVTGTDRKPNSVVFTYAYDDTAPASTFIVTDRAGALVCSSDQHNNTCTGTGAAVTGAEFRAFARNENGDGPTSTVVVPARAEKTITITCERTTVSGKSGIACDGTTTGLSTGDTLTPRYRFPGETEYTESSARPRIDATGGFSWTRKTGKKAYVYFTDASGNTKSNRAIIPAN